VSVGEVGEVGEVGPVGGVPDGDGACGDVELGLRLGLFDLGVVDLARGSGLAVALGVERGALLSAGVGVGLVVAASGGGRTSR